MRATLVVFNGLTLGINWFKINNSDYKTIFITVLLAFLLLTLNRYLPTGGWVMLVKVFKDEEVYTKNGKGFEEAER